MKIEQDLRFTSDEMLRMLERLRALESQKRKLKPGTDTFVKLAEEVESLAARVFEQTQEQQRLAVETIELNKRAIIDPPPIDEMPAVRELHIILVDWRDAERRLAEAPPGSIEASGAEADVERLRQEYRRAAQDAWDDEGNP